MQTRLIVLYILAFLFGLGSCGIAMAQMVEPRPRHVCVLNFERPEHPLTRMVDQVFSGDREVEIHQLAVPTDLIVCLQNRSTEILLLGHALLTESAQKSKGPVNLGFIRELKGIERINALAASVQGSEQSMRELSRDYYAASGTTSVDKQRLAQEYRKLQEHRDQVLAFPAKRSLYQIRPILPQIMRMARTTLSNQARSPQGVALRKIRLMSCLPVQVLAQYDDLRAFIKENDVVLDLAPTNHFLSFFEGEAVTVPNRDWLLKSALQPR